MCHGYEPMPLANAGEQLDMFRRAHRLTMMPPADYFLANCWALRTFDAKGPTAEVGWTHFVTGVPFVRRTNIFIIGDSGFQIIYLEGRTTAL